MNFLISGNYLQSSVIPTINQCLHLIQKIPREAGDREMAGSSPCTGWFLVVGACLLSERTTILHIPRALLKGPISPVQLKLSAYQYGNYQGQQIQVPC